MGVLCKCLGVLHINGLVSFACYRCSTKNILDILSWTPVAGKADQTIDMQNTKTLVKHTRDTVEILVSPIQISRNLGTFDTTVITTSSNWIVYLDSTNQKLRQRGIFKNVLFLFHARASNWTYTYYSTVHGVLLSAWKWLRFRITLFLICKCFIHVNKSR